MNILVAAASKHGSTWEIAEAISETLAARGLRVEVRHIEDVFDLSGYDGFVLGSAVYAGRWLGPASAFVRKHAAELNNRPVWLFSSGPLGTPPAPSEARSVDIGRIVKLIRIKEHRIFGGSLRKHRLDIAERMVARMVHSPQGDYRNWSDIRAWAGGIAESLQRQSMARWLHAPAARR